MTSLTLLQGIRTAFVLVQLVMIVAASRIRKEWLSVAQLSITVIIVALLISQALYFTESISVMFCVTVLLQLVLLPILWGELNTFEN